jgi:hypothetical protein
VPVAHAWNPSYSGGSDQEDCGLKPAQGNSSWDPIQKTLHKNRACGVAQDESPKFKPQNCKIIIVLKNNSIINMFVKFRSVIAKHLAYLSGKKILLSVFVCC